jgi:GntR family transcriptional regulator
MASQPGPLLYAKVESVLAAEIADGYLKPGDQLPTEDSLIARFEVSRITVRRAVHNLVSRGLVEIHRGKGTFVSAPKITQELTQLTGFVEDMQTLGRKPTAHLIGKKIVAADQAVSLELALTRGERVVNRSALVPLKSR